MNFIIIMLLFYNTLGFYGKNIMKKLILTSLGIISISLLFLTFTKKESHSSKNSIDNNAIATKNDGSELKKNNLEKEALLISNIASNTLKKSAITSEIPKEKEKIEKERQYLAYLNYRKEQYKVRERKMSQYLTHQKELTHIREGGVKSKLRREKRKHEVRFQNQYKSTMMSQRQEHQERFIEQKRKIERRREHMQSLKERQQLQTKYRGEL